MNKPFFDNCVTAVTAVTALSLFSSTYTYIRTYMDEVLIIAVTAVTIDSSLRIFNDFQTILRDNTCVYAFFVVPLHAEYIICGNAS